MNATISYPLFRQATNVAAVLAAITATTAWADSQTVGCGNKPTVIIESRAASWFEPDWVHGNDSIRVRSANCCPVEPSSSLKSGAQVLSGRGHPMSAKEDIGLIMLHHQSVPVYVAHR